MLHLRAGRRRLLSGRGGHLVGGQLLALLAVASVAAVLYLHYYQGLTVHFAFGFRKQDSEQQQQQQEAVPLPKFGDLLKIAQEKDKGEAERQLISVESTTPSKEITVASAESKRARWQAPAPTAVRYLQHYDIEYLREPSLRTPCATSGAIFLVASADPDSATQRDAIRDTWGSGLGPGGCTIFYATPSSSQHLQLLLREAERSDDLLVVRPNATMSDCSLASGLLFRLAERFVNASYFVRTNDKAFWNSKRLHDSVSGKVQNSERWLAGKQLRADWVQRDPTHPLFTNRAQFAGQMYPESLLENPGYAISRGALLAMRRHAPSTPLVFVRDVYLAGILRAKADIGIEPIHEFKASKVLPLSPCYYRLFAAVPTLTGDEMRGIWPRFGNPKHKCSYSFINPDYF